jgi:prepilin-type processing-associated H-X9-DG protein
MGRRSFTLVEFLIVVAVMMVIFSLLNPAFKQTLEMARSTQCLNQMREMMVSVHLYAEDFQGLFPDPNDRVQSNRYGWIDDNNSRSDRNTPAAIKRGKLYPYVGNTSQYRCPEDSRHVVSYQMSMLVGGYSSSSFASRGLNDVEKPSYKLVFAEEDTWRNVASGAWGIHAKTSNPTLNLGLWWDDVANWHRGGMNVSFVDGHVEYWAWQDPRTIQPKQVSPNGLGTTWHLSHPGSVDVDRTRRAFLGINPIQY